MKKEITEEAKTVEAAVEAGAKALGVDTAAVTYEVLREPKKGLFGIGAQTASVRITYIPTPEDAALDFVKTLLADMEIEATVNIRDDRDGDRLISVDGDNVGILIGHHGDTLDALQYLVNLAANRREDEEDHSYKKFSVDVENYRAKREETLRELARRMAAKVLKSGKSMTLEPMNPYERRIIHSEIQNIEGVSTYSVGYDNNRKIVIAPQNPAQPAAADGEAAVDAAGAVTETAEKPAKKQPRPLRPNTNQKPTRPKQPRAPKPADENGSAGEGTAEGRPIEGSAEGGQRRPYPPRGNRPPRQKRPDNRPSEKPQTDAADKTEETQSGNGIREMKQPYYMRPKNAPRKPYTRESSASERKETTTAEAPAAVSAAKTEILFDNTGSGRSTERSFAKPVKKDSVESYFSSLEGQNKNRDKDREEPSDIAKACGIYDDDTADDKSEN